MNRLGQPLGFILLMAMAPLVFAENRPPSGIHTGHKEETPLHLHHLSMAMSGEGAHAHHGGLDAPTSYLLNQSSGTSFQPEAWRMPMQMYSAGEWQIGLMGQAFFVGTATGSARDESALYSANWAMISGVRPLGAGALMLRTMLSLEPATVNDRAYPLLFQTGETAYGDPLVDGQHPHDFFMELGTQYAVPLSDELMLNLAYSLVGDPALGPTAFPHRASAMELPQATIAHHWQDSTHIANNVLTTGLSWRKIQVEVSGFAGREPNEARWDIDTAPMDSWSTRVSVFPARELSAQFSIGRLEHPEVSHDDDIVRMTSSLQYVRDLAGRDWSTSLIWAQNHKTTENTDTCAVVAETLLPLGELNSFTARVEWSERDELFEYDHELSELVEETAGKSAFPVTGLTLGYTRDIELLTSAQTGIGLNATVYEIDSALKPFYGNRPWSANIFVRARLR